MANDNITRKLRTLQDAAHMKGLRNLNSNYYICGGYIRELIDDLMLAFIDDQHETIGNPDYCPVCGSDDIEGGVFDNCDGTVTQECSCLECNSSWLNVFGYSIQDNIKKGGR